MQEKIIKQYERTESTEKHYKNNNGKRFEFEFCLLQNLIIVAKTYYQHKSIHRFKREMLSREKNSISECILDRKQSRHQIANVKVRKESEISSNHYLLVITLKKNITQIAERNKRVKNVKLSMKNSIN